MSKAQLHVHTHFNFFPGLRWVVVCSLIFRFCLFGACASFCDDDDGGDDVWIMVMITIDIEQMQTSAFQNCHKTLKC